jgi:hypothetical protein
MDARKGERAIAIKSYGDEPFDFAHGPESRLVGIEGP